MTNYPTKKLGNLISFEKGKKMATTESGDPYIGIENLRSGTYSIYTKEKYGVRCEPSDVLLVWDGAHAGTVGMGLSGFVGSTIVKVLHDDSLKNNFLFYLLKFFQEKIRAAAQGAAIPHLSKAFVNNIKIPLPPLEIQKQIVERLDKIVEAQKLNDDLIQKADELFQSLLHKELNPAGKGWEIKILGELFEITSSKRVFESEWTKQGVPFYRARELVSLANNQTIKTPIFISEKMFEEYKQKYGAPQEGDILVTGVGTIGISYRVKKTDKFYFKDGNIIWLKNNQNSNVVPKFVEYFFQTPFFKHQIKTTSAGATVLTYTIQNAKKTKIPLPPFKTQKQIADKLSAAQEYKTQLLAQRAKLKELFDSVLHKSMKNE